MGGRSEVTRRVALLPGAAGAGAFWAPITARLPEDWDKRAIDRPGLGAIPPQPNVNSYDDLVEHVARTISAPSAIVAQSMGSYVALQLTLQYPRLVTALVLAAATGGVSAADHGASEWHGDYATIYPQAAPWATAHVPDLIAQIPAIAVPTLLIWATRDALSPLSVAHTLSRNMLRRHCSHSIRTITGSFKSSPTNPPPRLRFHSAGRERLAARVEQPVDGL